MPSRTTLHHTKQHHTTTPHHNMYTQRHMYTHTPPHQVYTHAHNTHTHTHATRNTTQSRTDRDLKSFNVNVRICAQSTTDSDLETKKWMLGYANRGQPTMILHSIKISNNCNVCNFFMRIYCFGINKIRNIRNLMRIYCFGINLIFVTDHFGRDGTGREAQLKFFSGRVGCADPARRRRKRQRKPEERMRVTAPWTQCGFGPTEMLDPHVVAALGHPRSFNFQSWEMKALEPCTTQWRRCGTLDDVFLAPVVLLFVHYGSWAVAKFRTVHRCRLGLS